jgi:hypothetical protein
MTKQLYEEALADVKKLKEVAEDNAKRALLEAVTPRIRDLIENQLLGESSLGELEADPENLLMDELPPPSAEEFEAVPAVAVPSAGDSDAAAAAMSMPDEEGKVTLDLDALKVPGTSEFELSMESAKSLGMLLATSESKHKVFESKLSNINKSVKLVTSAGRLVKESKGYSDTLSSLISEVENTYSYLQTEMQDSNKKDSYESILESYYSTLKQLTEQKMKKTNTLSEADVTLKLTGMPDELDLDSIGVDLITGEEGDEESGDEGDEEGDDLDLGGDEEEEGGDEGESEEGGDELDLGGDEDSEDKMESRRLGDNVVVEIDEGMLRREIARMKTLRETADMPKNAEKGNGAGEVADGFEDDDLGDPFTDVELTTEADEDEKEEKEELDEMDEMDELDQAYGQGDMKQAKHDVDEMDELEQAMDEVDEMDEMEQATDRSNDDEQTNKRNRMPETLRRKISAELALQTEAKKKATQAKKKQMEAQKKAKQSKKMQEKQQAKKQAKKMQEAYNYFATKFNESVARTNKLKGMLSEATRKGAVVNGASKKSAGETNLRNKLAETNLFNAKLLFTNKLLQNESLTKRQKAEVIERLDEAKSEREVKLVYESLVKTLSASTAKITESADRGVIGSASRPARPASATNTLNEGFEADRWARLAGLIK